MDANKRKKRLLIIGLLLAGGFSVVMAGMPWHQSVRDRALLVAIENNDAVAALSALKEGADANCRYYSESDSVTWRAIIDKLINPHAPTALLYQLEPSGCGMDQKCNSPENGALTEALLSHGASTNVRDEEGDTPLLLATIWYKQATIDLLLRHRADVNASANSGLTPLMAAAQSDEPEAVRSLLKSGADLTTMYEGKTALTIVSEHRKREIMFYNGFRRSNPLDHSTLARLQERITQETSLIEMLSQAGAK